MRGSPHMDDVWSCRRSPPCRAGDGTMKIDAIVRLSAGSTLCASGRRARRPRGRPPAPGEHDILYAGDVCTGAGCLDELAALCARRAPSRATTTAPTSRPPRRWNDARRSASGHDPRQRVRPKDASGGYGPRFPEADLVVYGHSLHISWTTAPTACASSTRLHPPTTPPAPRHAGLCMAWRTAELVEVKIVLVT